jgi:hypothetical protein
MWINMSKIKKCRSCESKKLEVVWELEKTPYGDLFRLTSDEAIELEPRDLTLILCKKCSLLQLLETPEVDIIYEEYLYRTKITNALSAFYKQVIGRLINEYSVSTSELIIDIGSNDGSFLAHFKEKNYNVIGIEPTEESSRIANAKGIDTFNGYFDSQAVKHIKAQVKNPALICTNYTLANVHDLKSFLNSVKTLMDDRTIFSVITGYHPDQFAVNMFEYVNHDHIFYFSIKSFKYLCDSLDLKIIDATRVEHKGGSIQLILAKNSSIWETQSSVNQLAQREDWLDCNSKEYVLNLQDRIEELKTLTNELIESVSCKVYGIGASISTTHLIKQFNLSNKIEFLFDDDDNKIGRFAPGSGIPVKSLSHVPKFNNSLLIILAWQHTNRILVRLSELGFKGQVVIPLPITKIISI